MKNKMMCMATIIGLTTMPVSADTANSPNGHYVFPTWTQSSSKVEWIERCADVIKSWKPLPRPSNVEFTLNGPPGERWVVLFGRGRPDRFNDPDGEAADVFWTESVKKGEVKMDVITLTIFSGTRGDLRAYALQSKLVSIFFDSGSVYHCIDSRWESYGTRSAR